MEITAKVPAPERSPFARFQLRNGASDGSVGFRADVAALGRPRGESTPCPPSESSPPLLVRRRYSYLELDMMYKIITNEKVIHNF